MNFRDLLALYSVAGIACAIAVLRCELARGPVAIWSALATVPLWPLWAPFVLSRPRTVTASTSRTRGTGPRTGARPARRDGDRPALARIERALRESVNAVAGTPMAKVFSPDVAERVAAEVAKVAERQDELGELASAEGLDLATAEERLRRLEALGDAAPERTVATARLQFDTLTRLDAIRKAEAQAIEELADLLEALRAQLLLARYAGSSADGTDAIVSEVWARLEGLGAGLAPGPSSVM